MPLVSPIVTILPLAPRALGVALTLTRSVPALIVSPPLKELLPDKVKVPAPVFARL